MTDPASRAVFCLRYVVQAVQVKVDDKWIEWVTSVPPGVIVRLSFLILGTIVLRGRDVV